MKKYREVITVAPENASAEHVAIPEKLEHGETPRTDAARSEANRKPAGLDLIHMTEFAQKMERDRDHWVSLCKESIAENDRLLGLNRKLKGEIRNLHKFLKAANRGAETNARINWSFAGQINELREERDAFLARLKEERDGKS